MTRLQKDSRYTHKNLVNKREEKSLRMKLLRYVMAVGFVLSPWLGGEAYANAGNIVRVNDVPNNVQKTYLTGNGDNIAHIYAEQAHGDVGLNRFQKFEVGANQIANMHFQTAPNGTTLNHLVNTVVEKINISGTVNAIRENKIGGNLIFISPTGMVLNSSGVINAGSLTVLANNQTFTTAEAAYRAVHDPQGDGWYVPNKESSIEIYGQINTETGIDLRTETVTIKKAAGDDSPNPHLRTGVVFKDIVNTDFTNVQAWDISQRRLTLTKGEDGKIAIIDPSTSAEVARKEVASSGDGKINIRAKTDAGGNVFSGAFELTDGSIDAIGELQMDIGEDITNSSSSSIKANKITMSNNNGNIDNYGNIESISDVTIHASGQDNKFYVTGQDGKKYGTNCLVNRGTIKSTGGGINFDVKNGISNYGSINASGEIKMTALNGIVNQGMIKSDYSNVSFVIGREFFNVAKDDSYNIATYVPHDSQWLDANVNVLIQAGGNIQVSYTNSTIGKNPNDTDTVTYAPIGIYNSSTMRSGTAISATGGAAGNGSGNIWLTSSYDITNKGTMEAGRQITLNARDFLHNYGLIQGVTYLDIKSIMGYVYNHGTDNNGNAMNPPGRIIATGGNIDLSSGQANLQISGDNGTKKEEYRKFTPIIIEGLVEATSDLNNRNNETNQGNINITAYLGDIYVNGGTIRANPKPVTSGEKESAAGNVILDAAQNITIGFKTEYAEADDPTTDGANFKKDDEREYYKPKYTDGKLVNGTAAQISGSNIILTSGSGKTISMSTVNNTLTASNAINIDTASMKITAGTISASTLNATGALEISGGTVGRTDSSLTISGAKGLIIGNGATINTGGALTLTSSEGTIVNNAVLTAKGGAVNFESKGDITNNAVIEANGSVYITSKGGRVTNKASITAGKNFATPAASPFSLRARAMARAVDTGSVVISGSSGVINDNASASISAAGGVSITSETGAVQNSSAVNTSGSVEISGSSVSNSGALTTTSGSVEISGSNGIKNTGNITATDNVTMTASAGSIINTSTTEIKSTDGSVSMNGGGDVTSGTVTGNDVVLTGGGNVTGGTITGNDSVNMTGGGNVTGGTVTGSDVILTGGSNSKVTASSIVVDKSLQLQGDNITATNVSRSDNDTKDALNVGVSGAGGSNSTAHGKVDINISGDVVFSNVNVSNANVQTTGNLEVKKLHVEGNAQFASGDNTVNVYGQGGTSDPNAVKDKGDGINGWLTLNIDGNGVQTGFEGEEDKGPIDESIVQISRKLLDYVPYDSYMEHYGDVADIFGRTDLIVGADNPSGDTTQGDAVVMKQDSGGLSIEEAKKEEKKE